MIACVGGARPALQTVVACHIAIGPQIEGVAVPAVAQHGIGRGDHLFRILHGKFLVDYSLGFHLDEVVA